MTKLQSKQARATLDRRAAEWQQVSTTRPHGGWIRAIRTALGMSSTDLGHRMGVTRVRAHQIESGEVNRTLTLNTLERAADALGCDLVYALVPRRPLEDMVREQARTKAREQLGHVAHSMALEQQGVHDDTTVQLQLNALAEDLIDRRGLWADKP